MALRKNGVIRRVIGSPSHIVYQESDRGGLEVSWDEDGGSKAGVHWHFTWRTWSDVEQMHPTLEPWPVTPDTEMSEREVFGETLDEEIPDDLFDILMSLD